MCPYVHFEVLSISLTVVEWGSIVTYSPDRYYHNYLHADFAPGEVYGRISYKQSICGVFRGVELRETHVGK